MAKNLHTIYDEVRKIMEDDPDEFQSVLKPDDDQMNMTGKPNDLKDPEVVIQGYGTMRLSTLKKHVQDNLKRISRFVNNDEYGNAYTVTFENGVLESLMKTLKQAQEEIEAYKETGNRWMK